MKIIIAGDFCPTEQLAEIIERSDYSSIFGDVKGVISVADYAIVNFECPVIVGDEKPIKKCGPNLHCSERGVEAIRWAGFDCVTLANNHFLDFGEEGVYQTLESCKKRNIDVVGGGRNLSEASKVLYKKIDGKTLAIINCCEHEFSIATETSSGSNPLDVVRQYYAIQEVKNEADYILMIVHGGHEHYQLPSIRMQDWYRFFIDAGVDAVVNHHQHCFSGMEVYKDKPIFYGLGNFLFDTKNKKLSNTWHDGYMVSLVFEGSDIKFEIIPYRQCDGNLAVRLLSNQDDLNRFNSRLKELCTIISNRKELEYQLGKYYKNSAKSRLSAFEPYRGRLLMSAYYRGFLPSFLKGKTLARLVDYIKCESHQDIIKYTLHKKL